MGRYNNTRSESFFYVSLYCGADQMAPIKVFVLHENKKNLERGLAKILQIP